MVRGFYSAASGMMVQQRNFNVMASNIANLTTAGYKSENVVNSSFAEHLVARVGGGNINQSRNIGPGAFFTANVAEYTDFTQGAMEATGRSLDAAISGEGFFVIRTEDKGDILTRNGQFDLDAEMNLILPGVGQVLDSDLSPVNLEDSSFTIDSAGRIFLSRTGEESGAAEEVSALFIADVEDKSTLVNVGEGFYQSGEEPVQATEGRYQILQGHIEKPNVTMAQELSKVMAGQNQYTACSQVLKIYDALNQTLVTQIGKLR